jgi:phage shock protein PspC (stress-responsive transcriptional regulator)
MKKVININFQGRVIPIEENAYDILNKYIESLRKLFANEEGKEEIINDIEDRIAELFGEILKKGATCITTDDVNTIINSMGKPEDFDEEINQANTGQNAYQKTEQQSSNFENEPKRMFRDENNKVLGGVCSGVANYFGIDPVVTRVLFVIFIGVMFVPYLILWVAIPSSSTQVIGSRRKRLFRDPDDKILAGVCSGLSHYFGVSVWIPRLLFLIPLFSFIFRFNTWDIWDFPHFLKLSFSPGAFIIYIILWMILPEAKSTADKLEMKGEKVDLNNIKNTIQSDIEAFAKKAEKFGENIGEKGVEFGKTVNEKSAQFSAEAGSSIRKRGKGLGDIIVLIVKIFAYFILGVVLLAILASLFGIGITITGLLPVKNYIITNGWQNVFTWGTLILFIWVPIVAIVVYIVRRLAKLKGNSNLLKYTFSALWILGWVCIINLIVLLSKDFKYKNNAVEDKLMLTNPLVNKLEIKSNNITNYFNDSWLDIEPFSSVDEDSSIIKNVRIRIIKSNTDSFYVNMVKFSNGNSKKQANELAQKINFNVQQKDTLLYLDRGISINPKDKFRNQNVVVTIAVPIGKKIIIKENAGWSWRSNIRISLFNDSDFDWYNMDGSENAWRHNVEYIMTNEGLKRTSNNVIEDDEDDFRNENYDKDKLIREYKEAQQKADKLKQEIDKNKKDGTPNNEEKYKYEQTEPKPVNTPPKSTVLIPEKGNINNSMLLKFGI